MRTVLSRLGAVLAAGSTVLTMAACGGSTMLATRPDDDAPAMAKSATQNDAAAPVSATIRGSVVDASNRPLANVNIECLGNVQCGQLDAQPSAQGHQHRITQTDASGAFAVVASSVPGTAATSFLMNANGQGYQVEWQQVSWPGPACSANQSRCTVTVNFRLTLAPDPAQ
jgi:hypothetical protein